MTEELFSEEDEEHLKNCSAELGVLSQCDGSATLCNGPAALLAATFGPVEVRPQRELVDRAFIEVTFRGHCGVEAVEHRRAEQLVRATLEQCVFAALHPRTAVSLVINVLETDPLLLLSTAVNAAVLALLDASLALRFLPAAVTCLPAGDRVLVDPPPAQRGEWRGGAVTAVLNTSSGGLVSCHTAGRLSAAQLADCLREAGRAAPRLRRHLFRRAVAAKFAREPRLPWAGPGRAEDEPAARQRHGAQQPAESAGT